MKRLTFVLLLIFAFASLTITFSCNDNNEVEVPGEESSEGYEKKIINLTFDGVEMELPVEIDYEANTVKVFLLGGVNITSLTPRFELSSGAKVSPQDGVPYNFSKGMTFQVVAPDKTFVNYKITVEQINNEILTFKLQTKQEAFAFALRSGKIEKVADHEYTISAYIHSDDDITNLSTVVETSTGAIVSPEPGGVKNYTSPVAFTVSDGKGHSRKYTVTVTQLPQTTINWDRNDTFDGLDGIQMYTSNASFRYEEDGTPMTFSAYAVKVDLSKGYRFVPYFNKNRGNMTVKQMSDEYASINGIVPLLGINAGYFGGSSSYSLVIKDGELLSGNVPQLTRNGSFYVTRGAFGHDAALNFSAEWVYTINSNVVYGYPKPSPNLDGQTPQPIPSEAFPSGGFNYSKVNAVGGGPVLIREGLLVEDYQYELFYDDIIRSIANRTAIGVTANNELVLLVVDGRASYSKGISLRDMAGILKDDFKCVHAMNLDGGGSSTLVVNGQVYNQYCKDNGQRSVLTGLLIVKK